MSYKGRTVTINITGSPQTFEIEDLWSAVSGESWQESEAWAARNYRTRVRLKGLPKDNNVWYGKVDGFGYLVHVSEFQS